MDIDRVRYFNAFAETGSLVRASEILHISQPALSKALRLLEKETGLQLLEADGRGLRLTEAGRNFHVKSATLLQQWLDLPKQLRENESWKPTRIGSFEVFTTYFLGDLADAFDLTNLEIHEFGPGRLEEAIAAGKVDIGITYVPVPHVGVEFLEAGKIKMGVFSLKGKFRSCEFSELPFVVPLLPAEGTPSKVMGLDGWPDHRVERFVRYRVTMMESALSLCRKGLSVAYLPEFIALLHNQNQKPHLELTELPCPLPRKDRMQSVYLVQRKNTPETPLLRGVAKSIRSLK
jgi:DNA-binding transcriptional LysR family regulator